LRARRNKQARRRCRKGGTSPYKDATTVEQVGSHENISRFGPNGWVLRRTTPAVMNIAPRASVPNKSKISSRHDVVIAEQPLTYGMRLGPKEGPDEGNGSMVSSCSANDVLPFRRLGVFSRGAG
jgi:hypothetical protein